MGSIKAWNFGLSRIQRIQLIQASNTKFKKMFQGYADSDAWTVTEFGTIVGQPRDTTYKEILRKGVPIDTFMEIENGELDPVESCILQEQVQDSLVNMHNYDDIEEYYDMYSDLGLDFNIKIKDSTTKRKKTSKYGSKKTKTRTIASSIIVLDAIDNAVATMASEMDEDTEQVFIDCGSTFYEDSQFDMYMDDMFYDYNYYYYYYYQEQQQQEDQDRLERMIDGSRYIW